jgi:hypothetical protein
LRQVQLLGRMAHPKKLEKLLNLFVEKEELPQEKATEFLEKVREF